MLNTLTKTQIVIYMHLKQQSSASALELASEYQINLRSTQSLLQDLCDRSLVTKKRSGRYFYYSAT